MGTSLKRLDARTGVLLWTVETDSFVVGTPAASLDGRTIFVGSIDSRVYAINAADGRVKWRRKTGGPVEAGVVVRKSLVLAGSHDGSVHALGALKGEPRWTADCGAPVHALLQESGRLLASTFQGVRAFDPDDGAARWTSDAPAGVRWSRAVAAGDEVVVAGSDLKLYALGFGDGRPRWVHASANFLQAPASSDGVLYAVSRDKRVAALALERISRESELDDAKAAVLREARARLDAEKASATTTGNFGLL